MRSVRVNEVLTRYLEASAAALRAELAAGAEVGFELEPRARRRGAGGAALYCYRALTGEFIAERLDALEALDEHREAARALSSFPGLEPYLASAGVQDPPGERRARVRRALQVLLEDVFGEQSDFELRPERVQAALERLERAAQAGADEATLLATLHGLTITSAELALAGDLRIAQPDAFDRLPEGVGDHEGAAEHVLVALTLAERDAREAIAGGRAVLAELLRALRLFGDGRIALGSLAWIRVGTGPWRAFAIPAGGRPHGMLVVTAEQEDELRAFCNLVSRRAPQGDQLEWALRRFELGCERDSLLDGLTDHLLALRALLEPEGPASGLLPGRLAALCATPAYRLQLAERTLQAVELERRHIEGAGVEQGPARALAEEVAANLRALLRDVLCGHLGANLVTLADEILLEEQGPPSGEEALGDAAEAEQILDLLI